MSKHDSFHTEIFLAKVRLIALAAAIGIALIFEVLLAFAKAWTFCCIGASILIGSLMLLAEVAEDLRNMVGRHRRITDAMQRIEFETDGRRFGRR